MVHLHVFDMLTFGTGHDTLSLLSAQTWFNVFHMCSFRPIDLVTRREAWPLNFYFHISHTRDTRPLVLLEARLLAA